GEGVVPLERGPDFVHFDRVDAHGRLRTTLRLFAEEQLDVELQHVGDLIDHRELVEPADSPFDLVDPALGLPQPVGEHLLGHVAAAAPIRNPTTNRQLVHVVPPCHGTGRTRHSNYLSTVTHSGCGTTSADARNFSWNLQITLRQWQTTTRRSGDEDRC